MAEKDPKDPMTGTSEIAIVMHQLYLDYREAGFTEVQALELVRSHIMASQGGAR